MAKRYFDHYQFGRIRLPLDDFSVGTFWFAEVWSTIKHSTMSGCYWIYDTLVSIKDEISYRLNPTPYRYIPVSSIPRPSFEYDDFDE
jgi:hypothetical protein